MPVADRLRSIPGQKWVPLALLTFALATVFLFGNDRSHFYRPGHHDYLSSHGMSLAANLSPKHNFLLFNRQIRAVDGSPGYQPYSRFPVGAFALIKLAIYPFGESLANQIYAARMLMLVFFAAAAVVAYAVLLRLLDNRWAAVAATLLAFSSYYCLYYNDMVFNDVPSLFGLILTFHGMVVFQQEGRFGQLLMKSGIALLLGWQVVALILPFVAIGLMCELIQGRPNNSSNVLSELRRLGTIIIRSLYLKFGVAAGLFVILIMAGNLANEYSALDGAVPLKDLPSVNKMIARIGADPGFKARYADSVRWPTFLKREFYRIGGIVVPFSLPGYVTPFGQHSDSRLRLQRFILGIVGIAATSACLIGLRYSRYKILTASLLLSGFIWAFPMRHFTAFHDFQSLFYIGIPLVFFALALLWIRELSCERMIAGLAGVALVVFVLSSFQMGRIGQDKRDVAFDQAVIADFQAIRKETSGKSVAVAYTAEANNAVRFAGARHAVNYYLSGRVLGETRLGDDSGYDFTIAREREPGPNLITLKNSHVFLYDDGAFVTELDKVLQSTSPIIRAKFDIHTHENSLIYTRLPCNENDVSARFYLHLDPVNDDDLPKHRKQYGFDNRDFRFQDIGLRSGERCIAVRRLPGYDIAAFMTGQYTGDGRVWESQHTFDK